MTFNLKVEATHVFIMTTKIESKIRNVIGGAMFTEISSETN